MSNLVIPDRDPCPYCENDAGRFASHGPPAVVWQDELVSCFLAPAALGGLPGHSLVRTKRHVETIFDCTDQEMTAVALAVKRVAIAIRDVHDPESLVVQQHNGVAGWQTVPHVHVHVIPKTAEASLPPKEWIELTPNEVRQDQAVALRAAWPSDV